MPQNNLTIDMIGNKALEILENQLVLTRNCNRQYDDSFAKTGAKIGDSLRIRLPDRVKTTVGKTYAPEQRNEQQVTLTNSTQRHVGVSFGSAEMTMELDDYAERILKPRLSQLACDIDLDVNNVYKEMYMSTGTPGTTPGTTRVITNSGAKLDLLATPRDGKRFMIVDPLANGELVEGFKGLFHSGDSISKQFKSGLMATDILGFNEISMSQNIRNHTTGTRNTAGTVATTVSTQGASQIALSGLGASNTVKEGDVFTVAGVFAVNPQSRQSTSQLQQFVVTADATADGSGNATVSVSPSIYTSSESLATVTTFPQSSAVTTFLGAANTAYPQNIFYHKDAIAFVTADLVKPANVECFRSSYNGISLRVIKDYDSTNDEEICRIDVLYGFKLLRGENAGRLWG